MVGLLIFFAMLYFIPKISVVKIRVGVTGRFHTEELPSVVLSDIGIGLTVLDEAGLPEPGIAEKWETPDNGRTWIFTIKDGLVWQDGSPVTSRTIVYEFTDVETEIPDDKTIIFKLEDPFAPFPTIVSRPTFRTGLLGTGEWHVDKITAVSSYVSEIVLVNKSHQKKIYRFYPTESQAKLAYKRGEVDMLIEVVDPSPFTTWSTVESQVEDNTDKVVTLFFNTKDPLLSDKNIRQALDYAIDKTTFDGLTAISPIAPSSWAFNSQVKKYSYSSDRAKELLKDIPEELMKEPVKIVSIPTLLPVAEKISDSWNEVGINSIVQVTSIVPTEFQVYLTILDIPQDPDQYALWHSTQEATNISNYVSPRIDKLLEDGRLEMNQEERKKIYLDFQRFLTEDLPAAFLYHPQSYTIIRK